MNLPIKTLITTKRFRTIASLLLIIPTGFYTKFYSGPADSWVNDSLGGVFYEIFWCLVVFFFFQRMKPLTIAVMVLSATCLLEFLQLWHPPFLQIMRSSFIGAVILGTSFSWSDFPYYFVGSGIGWWWVRQIKNYPSTGLG